MAKKRYFAERLAMAADLPDEPIPGQPLVEIAGQRRVLIENHLGVTQYGCDAIRVRVKYGAICVCGQRLELSKMSRGQLVITGCIDSVNLLRGCP